ncbi:MAG: KpsF/GutQ family sugar-phosphate isomerase [Pirellulaceae bacterium]|jgi:arabinose-5-phosphate isomerase|nr:KpsF/GutQ family sugar-phosphate isomerase [Pirellulaceae bacterium]
MNAEEIVDVVREVLRWESQCLESTAVRVDASIAKVVDLLRSCRGRVVLTGMGKMGHIANKAAATFSSTGTPAFCLHPGEALHGDLGMVTKDDVVIAMSNSGETAEILELLPHILRQGIPVVALTGRPDSTLACRSTHVIDVSVLREADEIASAPTASTTVSIAMCDALAVALMKARGFTKDQFAIFHPSGHLGKKMLTTVGDVMHSGDRVPKSKPTASIREAILEMSRCGLGCVIAVNEQSGLMGILTDGDLRRLLARDHNPLSDRLDDHMIQNPKSIRKDLLAVEALREMEQHAITVLPVLDDEGKVVGGLHLHTLIQIGLA